MYVIIFGNPLEGFQLWGPFPTQDEAIASGPRIALAGEIAGRAGRASHDWWVAPLHTPGG